MFRYRLFLALVFLVLIASFTSAYFRFGFGGSRDVPLDDVMRPSFHGDLGIAYRLDPNERDLYLSSIGELHELGFRNIQLIVPISQKMISSTEHYFSEKKTLPLRDIRLAIQEAHRLDMHVMVFPFISIDIRKHKEWRGVLRPDSWDDWFQSYAQFLTVLATIAEEEGVLRFSVGSELLSSERQEAHWRSLISTIRDVFSGELIYSSNWDHLRGVPFWDVLDYVGMNFYYRLSYENDPTVGQMVHRFDTIRANLREQLTEINKPLIITELGYTSQQATNQHPWKYLHTKDVDLGEQRDAYEAFLISFMDEDLLDTAYFYEWNGKGGPEDYGYTPKGKPAEQLLKDWLP